MTKQAVITALLISLVCETSAFAENTQKANPLAQATNATAEVKNAVQNAQDKATNTSSDAKNAVKNVQDKATNTSSDAKNAAQNAQDKATNMASDSKDTIKKYAPDAHHKSDIHNHKSDAQKNAHQDCKGSDCSKESCKGADCNHVNCTQKDCKHEAHTKADASDDAASLDEATGTILDTTAQQMGMIDKIMSFFKN